MDRINDGGAAFPEGERWFTTDHYGAKEEHARGVLRSGMTLRDYFAAKATDADVEAARLAGENPEDPNVRCRARFRHADAMLRAREVKS